MCYFLISLLEAEKVHLSVPIFHLLVPKGENKTRFCPWALLMEASFFSVCVCVCVCVCMPTLSCVWFFANAWTVACQAPLCLRFSRQEYWSRLPFPTPGDLPDPEIKTPSLVSPAQAGRFFTTAPLWKPLFLSVLVLKPGWRWGRNLNPSVCLMQFKVRKLASRLGKTGVK